MQLCAPDSRRSRRDLRARPCSLAGTLVAAGGAIGPVRVSVHGRAGLVREADASDGTYGVEDLAPGAYRVELRAPRFVVARRVTLRPGEHGVLDFRVG